MYSKKKFEDIVERETKFRFEIKFIKKTKICIIKIASMNKY